MNRSFYCEDQVNDWGRFKKLAHTPVPKLPPSYTPEPIAKLVGRSLSERKVVDSNPVAAQHRGCKNGNISFLADARKKRVC